MNNLQFNLWKRKDPDREDRIAMATNPFFRRKWIEVRGAYYVNLEALGFEMVSADISRSPLLHIKD
jgi:hypothetical protein